MKIFSKATMQTAGVALAVIILLRAVEANFPAAQRLTRAFG